VDDGKPDCQVQTLLYTGSDRMPTAGTTITEMTGRILSD